MFSGGENYVGANISNKRKKSTEFFDFTQSLAEPRICPVQTLIV